MIWGVMSRIGVAPLKRITGIFNIEGYHRIQVHKAIPAGLQLIGKCFVLQQDNNPKHTSKLCQSYLEKKDQKVMLSFYQD